MVNALCVQNTNVLQFLLIWIYFSSQCLRTLLVSFIFGFLDCISPLVLPHISVFGSAIPTEMSLRSN